MIYNLGSSMAYAILINGSNSYGFDTYPRMVIYSGNMPTVADYATNWSTLYYWDEDDSNLNGTDVLGYYDTQGFNRSGSSLFNSTTPSHTYISDGTASWAAIWPGSHGTTRWAVTGSSDTNIASSSYILVPVTDQAGTGVIKLSNTVISGDMPAFGSFTLNLGTS